MSGASASELLSSLPQDVMMILMLIVVGFGYFFAAMNICGMTVYSREGESSWLMMVLPVTAATQLRGKILFSMSVTMLAALLMSIAFFFAWHAAWWVCAVMFIGITLLSTPVVLLGIYIDLARPRLHWDSERRAMKSNTNTIYGMLLELVYLAAMIGLVFLINDLTMFIAAAMGISLVLSVVIYAVMIKAAPRLQARMMELYTKTKLCPGKTGRFQTLCNPGTAFFILFCSAVDIENAGRLQVCKRRKLCGYKNRPLVRIHTRRVRPIGCRAA